MKLIKLEKDKNIQIDYQITYYLNPDYLYLPIKRGKLNVAQNDKVYKNDIVISGKYDILSPISGLAYGIKKCCINGINSNALVIANDFRELNKIKEHKKIKTTIPNILKVLETGKCFKLLDKFKSSKTFDNIVVSAINDNPYIYNKIFLLKENILDILEIMNELSILYKSYNNLLVIKNNESHVIDETLNVIGTYPNIMINLVNDEYLLEQEKYLLSKLGLIKNTLYLDITDLVSLIDLLKGKISTTKLITISGDAIDKNKVLRVKKYTLLSDILYKFIDIKYNNYKIIINGLMTGYEINSQEEFVITDEVDSINIMKNNIKVSQECINCGKCIAICPTGVNPINGKNKKNCIDCGLCSYICPTYINLREKLK